MEFTLCALRLWLIYAGLCFAFAGGYVLGALCGRARE